MVSASTAGRLPSLGVENGLKVPDMGFSLAQRPENHVLS